MPPRTSEVDKTCTLVFTSDIPSANESVVNTTLVLTLIGRDRPGLVERLAAMIVDHGGNWLESRMSRLGGEFAGILRVTVPARREEELVEALSDLRSVGLHAQVRRDDVPVASPVGARVVTLELVGQDRPGIVRQIAAALAARGANVEELVTERVSAPMSGEPLFKAQARLALPDSCDFGQLRAALDVVAADLVVDLTLGPIVSNP